MSSKSHSKRWLSRNKWYFVVAVPLLWLALAPFPVGCGMIYPIEDTLRGHPEGPHGTQPKNLIGFWIREEPVMYDFLGQAFYLMPDGRLAAMSGMTSRRWHFDDDRLFVDSVSHCGNCYRGNVTTEHTIKFLAPNRLFIANNDKNARRGIGGTYRRVEINSALKTELNRHKDSADENESFRARTVLMALDQFEALSNWKR